MRAVGSRRRAAHWIRGGAGRSARHGPGRIGVDPGLAELINAQ